MTEADSTASATAHKAFDAALDSTAASLRPVLGQLMTGVHEAVDRLSDVAAQAASKAELSSAYLNDSRVRMLSGCRRSVRAQPLTAIGVAVASGFVLSWILRQR